MKARNYDWQEMRLSTAIVKLMALLEKSILYGPDYVGKKSAKIFCDLFRRRQTGNATYMCNTAALCATVYSAF